MSESKKKRNYGKTFEKQVYTNFVKVDGVSIDRIPDQMTKFRGSSGNICDYIVYKKPMLLYLECKSVHGNTLSIHSVPKMGKDGKLHGFHGDIRDNQWDGLLEKSAIPGVVAGVMCWFVDKDITLFFSINALVQMTLWGDADYTPLKSVRYDTLEHLSFMGEVPPYSEVGIVQVQGKKKRTLFDYDMETFLSDIQK